MQYPKHALCDIFPPLDETELIKLAADIGANGLREPITLYEGAILDGGNRLLGCLAAGIEPTFVDFTGADPASFVLSKNLHRRHLSEGQRATIVALATDWARAQSVGGDRRSDQCEPVHIDRATGTRSARAEVSGTSLKTQGKADSVAKADPALARKVANGDVTLPHALKQIPQKPVHRKPASAAPQVPVPGARKGNRRVRELEGEIEVLQRLESEHLLQAQRAQEEIAELRRDPDERLSQALKENDGLRVQIKQLEEHLAGKDADRNECVRKCKAYKLRINELERQLKGVAS